jgi:tRNA(Ile)-lysidine synthase
MPGEESPRPDGPHVTNGFPLSLVGARFVGETQWMCAKPLSQTEADRLLAPLARFSRVALAVSGGPDSLALMDLAARWSKRRAGLALFVLTVDHALRAGSRAEAEMVGCAAQEADLPHTVLTWKHGAVDGQLHARARAARYDLMAAYCTAHDIPALVTAHNLDDQAETFLMRLKRGSGLDGLAAIPEEGSWAGLALMRPLLDVPKERLVASAVKARLPFVLDPSNDDTRFERGRIRGAAGALAMLGLAPEAIALSARRLRRARAALEEAAGDFLLRHGETNIAGYAGIDLAALLAAPEEIALRSLVRLIGVVGAASEPVRLAKLEALLALLKADPGKARTLGRCRLVPRDGRLQVFREMRKEGLPELRLDPGDRMLWDNRFRIELGEGASAPITVRALGEEGLRALKDREAMPQAVPRLAAKTLPACWRNGTLIGLPDFGQQSLGIAPFSRHEQGLECRAIFLRGAP